MGFFNPRPKRNLNEFFNMRAELDDFMRYARSSPLTLVLGLRRYGKTSLILTGLNALGLKHIYVDCKLLPSGMIGVSDFASLLTNALNYFIKRYKPIRSAFLKALRNVDGVSIGALGLSINLKKFSSAGLIDVFESLDDLDERIVLVVDEAQELRRLARYNISRLLAYLYDNLSKVGVVVSGSQIGLLYRTLKIGDPQGPLYGRAYAEVKLKRLSKELSKEFLIKGFEEENVSPESGFIDYVVEKVDGVIGWLTYIGFRTSIMRKFTKEAINKVLNEASKMTLKELNEFLSLRPMARRRYVEVLRAISLLENASWSNIYDYLQAKLGKVPRTTFNSILRNLIDAGFIEKREALYSIADPILNDALKHRAR